MQTNGYNKLFLNYLKGSIGQSLARVRVEKYTVPEAERVQAWHVLSYALEVEAVWAETLELLLALAPRMELAGFRYDWIPYLEGGVARGRALGDEEGVARLGLELGLLWMRMGEYDKARQWLFEAEEVFAHHNDASHRALALNRLADTAQQQGLLDEAHRLATSARELVNEDLPVRAYSIFLLGLIAFDRQHLNQAQSNFEEAARIWRQNDNERLAALSLQNLGRIHMAKEAHTRAIKLFEDAIVIFQSTGDVGRQALVRMNQGISCFLQEDFCQALDYYKLAEKGFKQVHDKLHLAMLNNNYGLLHLVQHQWRDAETFFQSSIAQWSKLDNDDARLNSMDGLGLSLAGQMRYEEASQIFEKALANLHKMKNKERRKNLHEKLISHLQEVNQGAHATEQLSRSFD